MSEGDLGRCRGCGAGVRWIEMAVSGKRNPLNLRPDPDRGNVILDAEGKGHQLGDLDAADARARGWDLYLSHFVTCDDREAFR